MNIIDDVTYHEVVKPDLKKDQIMAKWKIENTKLAIEALHHNHSVKDVEIIFNGYAADVGEERTYYDYTSRDKMLHEEIREQKRRAATETGGTKDENNSQASLPAVDPESDSHSEGDYPSSAHEGFNIPIYVDGKKIMRKLKKMRVSQLTTDEEGQVLAQIPIQTFLPFNSNEDPVNSSSPILE